MHPEENGIVLKMTLGKFRCHGICENTYIPIFYSFVACEKVMDGRSHGPTLRLNPGGKYSSKSTLFFYWTDMLFVQDVICDSLVLLK